MTRQNARATEEFIETMGIVMQADSLSRTGGRIFAYLLLKGEPVGFDQLADDLQISRSGVSTNTRDLERMGIIQRVSRAGDRQYYFTVTDGALAHLLEQHVERLGKAEAAIETALANVGADLKAGRVRLERLRRFYGIAIAKTQEIIREISEPPVPGRAPKRPVSQAARH